MPTGSLVFPLFLFSCTNLVNSSNFSKGGSKNKQQGIRDKCFHLEKIIFSWVDKGKFPKEIFSLPGLHLRDHGTIYLVNPVLEEQGNICV